MDILNSFMGGLGNITNLSKISGSVPMQRDKVNGEKENFGEWVKNATTKIIHDAKASEIQALDHTVHEGDITKLAHDVNQLQLTLEVLVPLRDHLVSIVKKFQEMQM